MFDYKLLSYALFPIRYEEERFRILKTYIIYYISHYFKYYKCIFIR